MVNQPTQTSVKRSNQQRSTASRRRRGLTLVEMMVSVALTLMVVFALVRVFEMLGSNVTDGRATIEMSGNLRTAADLLRQDLEGLTVRVAPPQSPSQNAGYFEIMDGPVTDKKHVAIDTSGAAHVIDLSDPSVVTNAEGFIEAPTGTGIPFDTTVGDIDDILAFTSRRTQEPFTGIISDPRISANAGFGGSPPTLSAPPVIQLPGSAPTLMLESHEAEIVWWVGTVNNTALSNSNIGVQITNGAGGLPQLYPNGTQVRALRRRVLLIRPDLDMTHIVFRRMTEVAQFLNTNDISVRVLRLADNTFRIIPNSLADLTDRQNRAYRTPISNVPVPPTAAELNYVYPLITNSLQPAVSPLATSSEMQALTTDPTQDLLRLNGMMKDLSMNNGSMTFLMLRKGKDVVLSDVFAFDVQVWDPRAIVRVGVDGTAITPSDPGYLSPAAVDGTRGAYVDLAFAQKMLIPEAQRATLGLFADLGRPVSPSPIFPNRANYCTWSTSYEYDGLDNNGNGLADEGRDGIDNNGVGGVDDPREAETLPPYSHDLRGIKVSLRIMDSATRQVRQTDVIHDFIRE